MAKKSSPASSRKPATRLESLSRLIAAGRFAECLAEAHALLERGSRDPDVLHLAARALLALGRHRDALPYLEQALAGLPKDPGLWARRALALSRLGQYQAADECQRKALRLAPRDANLMAGIGQEFVAAFRYREATEWLTRATELAPANLHARLALARLLERRGQLGAAREALEQALRIAPQQPDVILAYADALASAGAFGEAEVQLARILEVEPGHAGALSRLPHMRAMGAADEPLLARLREARARGGRERIELSYALGKACDDLGRYDEAFACYAEANALKRSIAPRHDRGAVSRTVDLMASSHGAAVLGSRWPGASESERPVLIVGMPRSGTSLVEQILAAHPMVHGGGEQNVWGEALDRHRRQVFLARYDAAALADIADSVLRLLASLSEDEARVTDKMPANFRFLGPIHVAFPRARILHVRRHPIDNCLSIHFQNFGMQHGYATDLDDLCHYYREYQRIMAHWRAVLPAGAMLEVPYEELVAEPERWSRRMVAFLGLPWDDACLAYHRATRGVGTVSKWQVRQPIYRSSVARWKNYARHLGPLRPLLDGDGEDSAGPAEEGP